MLFIRNVRCLLYESYETHKYTLQAIYRVTTLTLLVCVCVCVCVCVRVCARARTRESQVVTAWVNILVLLPGT